MIDPLLLAGLAVGGLVVLDDPSVLGLGPTPSAPHPEAAGDAITAAMKALPSTLAGVSFQVNLDASVTFGNMRTALVAAKGAVDGSPIDALTGVGSVPTGLSNDDLVGIMTAWLAAYDAGHAANPTNFARVTGENAFNYGVSGLTPCAMLPAGQLTSLGAAACALSAFRDTVASGSSAFGDTGFQAIEDGYTEQAFGLISALASEMDGADFVAGGLNLRASDQGWQWSDVPGGLAAAGTATLGVVAGAASSAAGAVTDALGGALVGSSLVWFLGFGLVAYLVLK